MLIQFLFFFLEVRLLQIILEMKRLYLRMTIKKEIGLIPAKAYRRIWRHMEALSEVESEKLEKIIELYGYVKELLLYAEELRKESFISPLNEFRDAFDHLMRVFSIKRFKSKDNKYIIKNLDAALVHLYRAMFQLTDYIGICQHEWIDESLKNISKSAIVAVFPQFYSEIMPELNTLIKELSELRCGLSKSEWELVNEKLDPIETYLEMINKIKLISYRINEKLPALHEYEGRIQLDHGGRPRNIESRDLPERLASSIEHESLESNHRNKVKNGSYDVFLCYNSNDEVAVKKIGERLKRLGILPWLDVWELRPGLPWQRLLEEQIGQIKSAAVFVGPNGEGPWQKMEIESFLREFVKRGCPVIPVLLSNANSEPILPIFLSSMTWVDFRRDDPDPIGHLIWGITGKRADFDKPLD